MAGKRIGVLGSGQVGQVLASGFLKHGYEVMVGSREPAKLDAWKADAGNASSVGTFAEAAEFGEVVVLAVLGRAAAEALTAAGHTHLAGKTVIDATNPIAEGEPENGVVKFTTNLEDAQMEQLQRTVPEARFVKAFSCVGNHFMVNPELPGGPPTMFICGNDDDAKSEVTTILDQFGWETADMGGVEAARAIEPLCMLWCIPGFLRNEWTHAFKLLKV